MASTPLGRLEKVELRTIWLNEATAFTPWLAQSENLRVLGEAIGIELDLDAQECEVGPFRADILCKDTTNDHWVLIENQIARTDHTHLGQLLTYAAGLQAVTIVWIAERFTEEHRAALDWLNEITDKRFNFFGLEIELWRIGDSQAAPKFNVVCKPNDWSKTVHDAVERVELTDNKRLQLEFWTGFSEFLRTNSKRIKPSKPAPQHWMSFAIGRSGFHLSAVASFYDSIAETYETHELRAALYVDGPSSKAHFASLDAQRREIEEELGVPLNWYNPSNKRMCRISQRRSVDLRARGSWPDYFAWLTKSLEGLHRVFAPRVRAVSASSTISLSNTSNEEQP